MKLFFKTHILLINIIALSCSDNRKDLLLEYSRLNCTYQATLKARDSLNNLLSAYKFQLNTANTQFNEITDTYEIPIHDLQDKIYLIKSEYTKKHIAISKKHEEKHGHFITPDYEKAIKALDTWKHEKLTALEKNVRLLNQKKQNDNELKKVSTQVDKLEKEVTTTNNILTRTEAEVKSLQKTLTSIDAMLDKRKN